MQMPLFRLIRPEAHLGLKFVKKEDLMYAVCFGLTTKGSHILKVEGLVLIFDVILGGGN